MAELGSVFEEAGEGPRGPDLRVSVEVPRSALGACLRAPVPRRIAAEGDLVDRAVSPTDEDPDRIELHLPESLGPRTMLRLRGQGGVHPEGRPGDLLVVVELVDRPPRADELILRSSTSVAIAEPNFLAPTQDLTWWVLIGLALVGGGVVAFFAL